MSVPLDDKEIHGIAKSIAKWTNCNFSEDSFSEYVIRTHSSEIQSIRGAKGGRKSSGGGRKNP